MLIGRSVASGMGERGITSATNYLGVERPLFCSKNSLLVEILRKGGQTVGSFVRAASAMEHHGQPPRTFLPNFNKGT